MIYLVSNQIEAFNNEFIPITVEKSKELILNNKSKYIQYDSETGNNDPKGSSLDPHTGFIYSIQFGLCYDQIVVDCTTVNIKEYKNIFESNKLRFVGQNLMFDIQWLFKNSIIIKNIYDTMIAEQLLHLGEDNTKNAEYKCIDPLINPDYNKIYTEEEYLMYLYTLNHKFALKSLCWKYLGVNLDKTVRGEINNEGLTTRVIKYAAGDVTYLNTIMEKQIALLKQEGLLKAALFEFKALLPITYMAFCGVKIDSNKWLAKSSSELPKLNKLKDTIYQDILDFYNNNKAPSINGKPYVNRVYIIEGADKIKKEFDICREKNIPVDADRDQKLFEDKIIYSWKVPFGYVNKGKFIPYVIRDMQGDLFSGFNTELQVNDINLSSSYQLIPLLTMMGVDCMVMDKKTHDKKESFGKSIIALYADKFPIIKHFGEYKVLSKQLDSFGPKFLNNINYKTKRFYAQWHQLGTRTGRISSSNPINLGLIIVIL